MNGGIPPPRETGANIGLVRRLLLKETKDNPKYQSSQSSPAPLLKQYFPLPPWSRLSIIYTPSCLKWLQSLGLLFCPSFLLPSQKPP